MPASADDMSGMDMGGAKTAQKPKAASLSVMAAINPAAPRTGDNTLDLTILDATGKPVTGLKLTTTVAMTSMDMGTAHPAVTETGSGHYTAKVNFGMGGPWRVVVRIRGNKVAVLDFTAGAKMPWKSPQIKAALTPPGVHAAPAQAMPSTKTMPAGNKGGNMAGMEMGGSATAPPKATSPDKPVPADGMTSTSGMPGIDMGGKEGAMADMKMGIADMKTATVPQLQEKGTYTATGNEDWKAQTGFGHNAGMVGMMNQMMVGGSGMEGMKMAPMNMKFDEQNYAKPTGDDAGDMAGMDMGGKPGGVDKPNGGKAGEMSGMKMDPARPAAKQNAPTEGGQAMPGMNMAAPKAGENAPASSAPVQVTATTVPAPKAGDNALTISITDAQGKPVTGATVTTSVAMTSMDMGTTHPPVMEKGGGKYTATVTFSMAGPWRVKVKVTPPGQKSQTKAFDFTAK
jgi:nitrogen fixation protein FixH